MISLRPGALWALEQLFHPRIVIDAVDDDDFGVAQRLRRLWACLEKVRVVVRIGEDAGHDDVRAADLGGEVAIEILRRDHFHRIGQRGRG